MSDACAPFRELLSAQLDLPLEPAAEEALLAHLVRCSACATFRRRLGRTVEAVQALRAEPLVPVDLDDALTALEARLAAEAPAACQAARERLSARIDHQLGPEEAAPLAAHLAECAACAAFATRLGRTVAAVRAARPLVVVPPGALAELTRRLTGASAGARLLRWPGAQALAPRLARLAAAAAVLALAGYLAATRFPALLERVARHEAPRPEVKLQPPSPSATPDPASPDPAPGPPPAEAPPPPPEVDLPPAPPAAGPVPPPEEVPAEALQPESPAEPTPPEAPTPPAKAPAGTESREPAPAPEAAPALALADLQRLIARIESTALPAQERAALVESLGQPQHEADLTYAFLRGVLERGALDRFPLPDASRRAAFLALGRLDTPRAVSALLRAPLRPERRDHDEAALLAALERLQRDEAVRALSRALGARGLSDAHRWLAVAALERLARPAAAEGLLALFAGRGEPAPLRRAAGRALGWSGDPAALDPLRQGLTDRRALIRQGAAWGLGALAGRRPDQAPACVAALEEVAARRREPDAVVEAAVTALGRTRHRAAVPPLIARLEPAEGRRAVRLAAHRSLCQLAGREPRGVGTAAAWRTWWEGRQPAGEASGRVRRAGTFRGAAAASTGVVFVVDLSGSMDAKRALAEFELEQALRLCPSDVSFAVVVFGDGPKLLWPDRRLVPATPAAKQEALERLARQPVWTGAQTGLARGLEEALAHLEADAVYLLSDGQLDPAEGAAARHAVRRANAARERPARLHAIHLRDAGGSVRLDPAAPAADDPPDVDLMRRLAWENDGTYAHN